uniref:Uncharacterized protein n=1 Tax=Anguilla anguilla TaxID=7936 RepID=A0A0E9UT63_ANGAN
MACRQHFQGFVRCWAP